MTRSLRPLRLGGLLLAVLLASAAFAAPTLGDSHDGLSAVVTRSAFNEPDVHLTHNIPDLRVTVGDGEVDCNFLSHYESTGAVIRWGFATSEVIEESPGSLTQYYQRGVVDCHERDGTWRMERRLVWDYIGGGLGDAPDLGVEPNLLSEQAGQPAGPWGHRVSNFAIDGTVTGFLGLLPRVRRPPGLRPAEERRPPRRRAGRHARHRGARNPASSGSTSRLRCSNSGRAGTSRCKLRLLGDAVRDRLYPFSSHQVFDSFQAAGPLSDGEDYSPGERLRRGRAGHALRIRQRRPRRLRGGAARRAGRDLPRNERPRLEQERDHWLSDAPLGEWFGVTTDAHDRVVSFLSLSAEPVARHRSRPRLASSQHSWSNLDVQGNQLHGEIPPEIGDLDKVTHLSLWANQFSGSIPAEIGDMASLQWAALGINELTGEIPRELGNLSTATHLDFTLNQLRRRNPSRVGQPHQPGLADLLEQPA